MPVQATDKDGNDVTDSAGNPVYEKNKDGSYVCDPNTVPERVIAYRALNGLAADVKVPVDAVTASALGPRPGHLGRQRPAPGRTSRQGPQAHRSHVVDALIATHTDGRAVGRPRRADVNVLDLNLALDRLRP